MTGEAPRPRVRRRKPAVAPSVTAQTPPSSTTAGVSEAAGPVVRAESAAAAEHVRAEPVLEAGERWTAPGRGWTVIAAKEFGDHLNSARMFVLLILLGIAAIVPLYFAADRIRAAAPEATDAPAVFLFLFTLGPEQIPFMSVVTFIGLVAPLLGVAFSFDAVNGERADGTLPRLLSQPIHRDDVINGKFVGGLAIIGLVLVSIVALISGYGLVRLGIVSTAEELFRLLVWLAATLGYVSMWLAFGLLLSVLLRRAASSALVGLGVWVLLTIFGPLIAQFVRSTIGVSTASDQAYLDSLRLQELVSRLIPYNLYQEVSLVLLNPTQTRISTEGSVGQYIQAQQRIPTLFSLDQSLLLVWPHLVALVALTVVCFAAAYVSFMRQEVRA